MKCLDCGVEMEQGTVEAFIMAQLSRQKSKVFIMN